VQITREPAKRAQWLGRSAQDRGEGIGRLPGPAGPGGALPPGSTLRTLTVEADGVSQEVSLAWHQTPAHPGYGVAFDIIDGVIQQLSGADVPYRSTQPPIVTGITELA
jgi:hypothetical protein